MTPKQAEEMLRTLKSKALSLDELHERARCAGSPWSTDQLQLFLRCAPHVEFDERAGTYRAAPRGEESELQDAILEAVRSFAGRAVPAVEVRRRLPDRFVTTDEQVRAIAKRTSGLEVIGPGLIRIAQ